MTAKGTPCRAWAVKDTNPPRCAAHGGTGKKPGTPKGNQNAKKHGFYSGTDTSPLSITEIIVDLSEKQRALSVFIDDAITFPDIKPDDLIPLFTLHANTASRLGKLLRDQHALSGAAADGIAGAIGAALDEIADLLGINV